LYYKRTIIGIYAATPFSVSTKIKTHASISNLML
jgi:hypothetical protein